MKDLHRTLSEEQSDLEEEIEEQSQQPSDAEEHASDDYENIKPSIT